MLQFWGTLYFIKGLRYSKQTAFKIKILQYIKIENFRTENFRQKNFGQKTFGRFLGNFGQKTFGQTGHQKASIIPNYILKINVITS